MKYYILQVSGYEWIIAINYEHVYTIFKAGKIRYFKKKNEVVEVGYTTNYYDANIYIYEEFYEEFLPVYIYHRLKGNKTVISYEGLIKI